MHRMIVLIALCCGCVLAEDMPVSGDQKTPANKVNPKTMVYNVLDYGAVGDNKTDNTPAFSACLKKVIDAGGGRMYLPAGVYCGNIIIPPFQASSWIVIEIAGECQPAPVFGTVGSFPLLNNGTIIKSSAKSGPAVIDATPDPASPYGSFSMFCVVVKDLEVRTYNDPGIDGIDLGHVQQCRIENVVVNTDTYSVQASKPTHGTAGIITPKCNNAALTILRNVVVTGYNTGIVVNEHTDADNINLACNYNGLEFVFAHHASRFGRVGAQRCSNSIAVTGRHPFCIEQLDVEVPGDKQTDSNNKWQALESNIKDPGDLGTGDINYWVVRGGVGAVTNFIRKGGANIQARRIGTPVMEK